MGKNEQLFIRAQKIMPGGVNSPVRAFKTVGGTPIFIEHAQGSKMIDVNGKTYIDFVGSWGPLILGHAHEKIIAAISKAVQKGSSFGAPTEGEILLAEKITQFFPHLEKIRLVNSGTEATMSALRLARAVTKRDLIIKFAGCYHGHSDQLLVSAGSGALTLGIPDSAGVSVNSIKDTLVLPYNDIEAVNDSFKKFPKKIAAIIVEPIAGNMGCVLPKSGFLKGLREITQKNQSLLIFDEVMTGFRLAKGGAQERFDIKSDITCLGKIIGGGLPVGAYGGSNELMSFIAPEGPVYQAGTLSGNPLAVQAGLATLNELEKPGIYQELEKISSNFYKTLKDIIHSSNLPLTLNHCGSMFCLYFHKGPIEDLSAAKACDQKQFSKFFHLLLEEGIYWPPSPFESAFLNLAHYPDDLEKTGDCIKKTLKHLTT